MELNVYLSCLLISYVTSLIVCCFSKYKRQFDIKSQVRDCFYGLFEQSKDELSNGLIEDNKELFADNRNLHNQLNTNSEKIEKIYSELQDIEKNKTVNIDSLKELLTTLKKYSGTLNGQQETK